MTDTPMQKAVCAALDSLGDGTHNYHVIASKVADYTPAQVNGCLNNLFKKGELIRGPRGSFGFLPDGINVRPRAMGLSIKGKGYRKELIWGLMWAQAHLPAARARHYTSELSGLVMRALAEANGKAKYEQSMLEDVIQEHREQSP